MGQLALALAFGIVITFLLSLDLDRQDRLVGRFSGRPLPGLCRKKQTTGEDCPTCGLTRGLVRVGRLEFEAARSTHPSAPGLALLLLLQLALRPFLALLRLRHRPALWAAITDFLLNFGLVLWVLPWPLS